MFTSWTDSLIISRHSSGAFVLRIVRVGIDDPGTFTIWRIVDTQIVVLDGATGTVRKRIPLAREWHHGSVCDAGRQTVPQIAGPIVGTDGHGYLVVRNYTIVYTDSGGPGCSVTGKTQDTGLTLMRIAPSGSTSATTFYSQHCEGPIGTTCDEPPLIYEIFPDGIGGTLVRSLRTTAGFEEEMRLTRITDQGVEYDVPVDFDERIYLIGDAGTAFVAGDGVAAKDVTNWTAKWTNANLSGNFVAALPNGGLAMHDSTTGSLVELDASGNSVQSAALVGSFGNQSAFGTWTSVNEGTLAARLSLPLNESPSFQFLGGEGTRQNAWLPPRGTDDLDTTAIMLMSYIYSETSAHRHEVRGIICSHGSSSFFWHQILVGTVDTSPGLELNPEQCPDGAITVGYAHTHPPDSLQQGQQAPPPGVPICERCLYPSGFWTPVEYHDANPNLPGQQISDLKIADTYFTLSSYPQPKAGNVTWYVASKDEHNGQAMNFFRYKKTAQLDSKDNLFKYNPVNNIWTLISARW